VKEVVERLGICKPPFMKYGEYLGFYKEEWPESATPSE
jgi:hypothetical protein